LEQETIGERALVRRCVVLCAPSVLTRLLHQHRAVRGERGKEVRAARKVWQRVVVIRLHILIRDRAFVRAEEGGEEG
jgi:hypothetical protein